MAFLQTRAFTLNAGIADSVLSYVAEIMPRSISHLERALWRLADYAASHHEFLDVTLAKRILRDMVVEPTETHKTIEESRSDWLQEMKKAYTPEVCDQTLRLNDSIPIHGDA
jgi:chromosomal replication initiation ATPase DnaA